MQRVAIVSSNLESAGWEDDVLEIEFNWGGVYHYENVPQDVYESLVTSPAPGEYFTRFIKQSYKYKRIS